MNNYFLIAILISEILAIFLILKIWKTDVHAIMKLVLSLIALVPFIGLFLAAWVANFPPSLPEHLQVNESRGAFTHKLISKKKRNNNK